MRDNKATLGINDTSLEKGGVFDIFNNWGVDHITHRTGMDVDIDKKVSSKKGKDIWINCKKDKWLEDILKDTKGASLLCESRGRKHIDFD